MNDIVQYPLQAKADFIKKVAQATPVNAVAELIWNSLDADSNNVWVTVTHELDCVSTIEVKDDGHGINYSQVQTLFTNIGNSWKRTKRISKKGRELHGKEGKGRLKAKSLGRVCDWITTYQEGSEFYTYTVSIIDETVRITDKVPATIKKTGTKVIISELIKDFTCFDEGADETTINELTDIFAIYLKHYSNINIFIGCQKLDIASAIKKETTYILAPIEDVDIEYPSVLEIIEWNKNKERKLYLCTKAGFPALTISNKKFQMSNYSFSAYLKTSYVDKLIEDSIISLSELDDKIKKSIDDAIIKIKEAYRIKLSEDAKTVVDQWKQENTYPYKSEPQSVIQGATRQMFDIVAVNVSSNIPDFMDTDRKTRAFQLRLLREVVEKTPEDVQDIISSVLDLPKKEREALAALLKNTNLSSVISMAQQVTNRLHFINGIEELLFSDFYKKDFAERKQLQKLLEENTWFFGEQFHLVANDESLTNVLKKYAKECNLKIELNEPVQSFRNKKRDIIDLMIAKTNQRSSYMEQNNLVIELKSPKQPVITNTEVTQIEGYATAIAKDERFHGIKASWNFFVISNELDAVVEGKANQSDRPRGLIYQTENIKIWVKTWAELLQDNKERHKFLEKSMNQTFTKSESLQFLQCKHKQLLDTLIDKGRLKEEQQFEEKELFEQNI